MKSRLHTFCVFFLVFFLAINIVPIQLSFAASTVHFLTDTMNRGAGGSITFSGVNYQSGQSTSANEANYVVTGNPPSNYFFYQWVVMWLRQQSWVANQYSQTTTFYLREEAYLTAKFYSPIHTDNPTSPITWGAKQRITGTASQYSGQSLSVVYCSQGSGMGPPNRNGVPPFGSGNNGYLWKTVTVTSGAWDTGYIYPTLPISLGQQLPQTYDVYALYGSDPTSEVDSNVVSFTLNPATPQMSAPTLTPGSIQLGQATTITDQIFSSAYVNSNDLSGTLTVQARKQGISTWTDIATQSFTSSYGYSNRYGQYGDYYDLSTSWTPSEAGTFEVRIVYGGNHYFYPVTSSSSFITVGQPTYDVTIYGHCNTESTDISVQVKKDSDPSGPNTPATFTGLTGMHTFTVPNSDSSGHPFKQWSTGETSTALTVGSTGTYTAYYEQPPPTFQFTVNAYCNTESRDVSVTLVVDDSPPGHPTPYSFTSTISTHKFTVSSSDPTGHPFKQWNTGETSTTLNVNSGGIYTAYYEQPPPTFQFSIQAHCNTESTDVSVGITMDDSPTSFNTPHTFTSLVATHKFTVPNSDSSGHPFKQWSTGETSISITVPSGTYTAYYEAPPNNAPLTPSTPQWITAEQILYTEQQAYFSSSATDLDNDQVQIIFDWGDGTIDTSNLVSSGTPVQKDHAWSRTGMFEIKAKAKDIHGAESGWSSSQRATVVVGKIPDVWAGYVVNFKGAVVTISIEGKWIYPSYGTIPLFSSQGSWVGLGGVGSQSNLLQAGIATENPILGRVLPFYTTIDHGHAQQIYGWEHLNNIAPGDVILSEITQVGNNEWQIYITDQTRGWTWMPPKVTFQPDTTYAEWIHEPGASGSGIGDFSSVSFQEARVTVNGATYKVGSIDSSLQSELSVYNMVRRSATCTRVTPINEYEKFTIYDTGQRPASVSPITGISLHSNAYLAVYDSHGNHDGFNATTGFVDVEIPDSLCFQDQDGAQYIVLSQSDSYQIDIVGTSNGDFHLHTQTVENETITLDSWTNQTITVNETKTYSISHEISLKSLTSKTVIGGNYSGSILVTVANNGNYTESFNVTLYANTTIVGIQLVTLANTSSTNIAFMWNSTGLAYGNYTLTSTADTVPGEIVVADNNRTSNIPVHVGVPGDISGPTEGVYDGTTNMRDINYLIQLFNTNPSSPNWKPNADINNDVTVNMRDIQIAILNFNKHE